MRVVLCGLGRFGRVYAQRVMEHAEMELVGVVEVAEAHGSVRNIGVRPFDSLGEAIDVAHPQLVIVATPPALHARFAIEALQRYCHVMLAKPGAIGLDEAERVAATAWEHYRRVLVDWTPMMSPAWARLRSEPWADGILTMRLIRRGVQRYQDCGVLWDLASHDVALALDIDWPDRVVGVSANAWWYPDYDEPVGAFLHLRHQSGRVTRIEVDWMAAATERRVEIVEYDRMHVWDQITDETGWTRRGYRCDDDGSVIGVWDLEVNTHAVIGDGSDNVTRALSRALTKADDTKRLLEVTRILDAAEASIYGATERAAA